MPRFVAIRAYKSPVTKIRKLISQLRSHFYVMNEAGGVAHTIPDHEKLIRIGTDGFLAEISAHQQKVEKGSDAWQFHEAMKISVTAFAEFCGRYHDLALGLAETSTDAKEKHGTSGKLQHRLIKPRAKARLPFGKPFRSLISPISPL